MAENSQEKKKNLWYSEKNPKETSKNFGRATKSEVQAKVVNF